MTIALTRRAFVTAGITAAGGLAIAVFAPRIRGEHFSGGPRSPNAKKAHGEINAFVVIDPDNSITLRVAKSEMGQGVLTSLAMILAEELECDFSKVKVEYASAHRNLIDNGRLPVDGNRRLLVGARVRASSCSRRAHRPASG